MIGAALGAFITLGLSTAAGITLLLTGTTLVLGGTIAGSFVGAMESRGEEGALADFYDQALTRGDLLVAVTDSRPGHEKRLAETERVLRNAGAQPLSLDSEV